MILKNNQRIDGCSDTVPIGSLNPYLGSTAPYGYLICEGQLVSKVIYPELYSICGSLFGQETSTEFYLPDLRGQTIAGYKENDSIFGTLGGLIGSLVHSHETKEHTLTVNELPSHTHKFEGHNGVTYNEPNLNRNGTAYDQPAYYKGADWTGNGYIQLAYTGGGQAHNHGDTEEASSIQPTLVLNWIVKAFQLMPNQSYVATSQQTSDVNTYSCTYINNHFMPSIGSVGTWVPYLANINGNNPTVEYTTQNGWYQIIGNVAFIECYMRFKITSLNASGDYAIVKGIPSAIMNNVLQSNVGNIGLSTGVIYNALQTTSNLVFVLDAGSGNGVRPQSGYGASATQWKVTDTAYAEIGFSGFILLNT